VKHAYILAAFAAALTAAPAQAQPVAADLLPAYEVATIVTSMGMRPVGRPAWLDGRYVVAAIDRHGREVNVVIDAFDGQVIAVRPLGRNSFGAPPGPGPSALPPGDEEFFDNDRQQGARPPAPVARVPRDPAATGSVARGVPVERKEAARTQPSKNATPMPRPRPALAKANDPGNVPAKPEVAATPVQTRPASAGDAAAKDAAVKDDVARPDAAKSDAAKSDTAKSDTAKPDVAKPDTAAKPAEAEAKAEAKPAPAPRIAKPAQARPAVASKPESANKPATGTRDIRVIDLSKPQDARKPEVKPGEAIRF
jgi:hypothetical protein